MPSTFPSALDSLVNPDPNTSLAANGHAALHATMNSALNAIEERIGVAGSADSASIEHRLTTHTHSGMDGVQLDYASLSGLPTLGTAAATSTTAYDPAGAAAAAQAAAIAACPAETVTTYGSLINSATAKTTPVDADYVGLMDSAASNVLKKLSWESIKKALQAFFATLAGFAGGQTLKGGTAASETLTLQSTAHATKGKITALPLTIDEANLRVGVGQTTPTASIHIKSGTATASTAPIKLTAGTYLTATEAGAVEYNGTRLTLTAADTVRRNIATEDYARSFTGNMIANGFCGLLDNTNFSGYTFDATSAKVGGGSFRVNVSATARVNDELIPVDQTQRYRLSLWMRSGDQGGGNFNASNKQYVGIALYDLDGLLISIWNSSKVVNSATDTTLAATLNPGDTTITLANATGWNNDSNVGSNNFSWFGYANSKGYTYPDYTYTRNGSSNYSSNSSSGCWTAGGISGNVITLRVPWAGPSVASGTAVRNSGGAGIGVYAYIAAINVTVPNSWAYYSGYIGGEQPANLNLLNSFRPGAAYLKVIHYVNAHGAADNNVYLSGLSLMSVSSANLEAQNGFGATYKASLQSVLPANGIAVEGKSGFGTLSPSAKVHAVDTAEQARFGYDTSNYVSTTVSSSGAVAETIVGTSGAIKWLYSDATTNAVYSLATFSKNSTGGGAAGLGVALTLAAKSSTTADTPQVTMTSAWIVATHATRTARGTLNAVDYNATREGMRWESDGTAARLGFFGVTAVVKPTALTTQLTTLTYTAPGTPDYAIASVTQTTPYGFTSADEAHTVLSVIKNLQDRVGQLETKLQSLGLLT
jgi:hypothetical protein